MGTLKMWKLLNILILVTAVQALTLEDSKKNRKLKILKKKLGKFGIKLRRTLTKPRKTKKKILKKTVIMRKQTRRMWVEKNFLPSPLFL
jgi:hypothetical protein